MLAKMAVRRAWASRASGRSISTPAQPDYGHITSTPKPGWAGADVLGALRRGAGVPTAFDTDVNGAAFAEMRWGAGRGLRRFRLCDCRHRGRRRADRQRTADARLRPLRARPHSRRAARRRRVSRDPARYHGDCVEGLAAGPSLVARVGAERVSSLPADDPVWDSVAWALAQLCHAIVCAAAPRAIAIGGGVVEKQPHLLGADRDNAGREPQRLHDASGRAALTFARRSSGAMPGPLGAIALAMNARP